MGFLSKVVKIGTLGAIDLDSQGDAVKDASRAQIAASESGIAEQRAAREAFEKRTEPFRELGLVGSNQLTSFLEDPTQQLGEINPIVDFLRQQGFEQIQESAAARGRLGAGGTLRDLTQFNTDLTSTIIPQLQNQRFNQLFNVAGLGANVAAGQGTAGLQTASNIGNLQNQIGSSRAGGIIGEQNVETGFLNSLFKLGGAAIGGGFGGGGFNPASVNQGQSVQQIANSLTLPTF